MWYIHIYGRISVFYPCSTLFIIVLIFLRWRIDRPQSCEIHYPRYDKKTVKRNGAVGPNSYTQLYISRREEDSSS